MASALIKFDQGAVHGMAGHAFVASSGAAVSITNGGDNSDALSWRIELLYGPSGSTFERVPGIPLVLAQGNGNNPVASLTPTLNIPGSYRIRLTVWEDVQFKGVYDVDIRNIVVLTAEKSLVLPPYQDLPAPIPLAYKPDELNIEGQPYGWSGSRFNDPVYGASNVRFRLLNAALLELDTSSGGGGGGGGGSLQESYDLGSTITIGATPVVMTSSTTVNSLALNKSGASGTALAVTVGAGASSGIQVVSSSTDAGVRVDVSGGVGLRLASTSTGAGFQFFRDGTQTASFGAPAVSGAAYFKGSPSVSGVGQDISLEGGDSSTAFKAGDAIVRGGTGGAASGDGYLLGGSTTGRSVMGIGSKTGVGLAVDNTTVASWSSGVTGYLPYLNKARNAIDWAAPPTSTLPSGGEPPELLGYGVDELDLKFVRFVTAAGSDIWFPGDVATLGTYATPIGMARTANGTTFTVEASALAPGFSPSLMVYDAQEEATLLFSHGITGGNAPTNPQNVVVQNVLSTSPLTLEPYVQLANGTGTYLPTTIRCWCAPGNGYVYLGLRSNDQWSSICRYNVSIGQIDQINNSTTGAIWFQTAHGIAYDSFTAKYGDGYPRLYVAGKDSSSLFRISTNNFSEGESTVEFPTFGGSASVIAVDGANNAGYTVMTGEPNNQCIIKFRLEPFGTVLYSLVFTSQLGGRTVGIMHVPSQQKVVLLHEHYINGRYIAFVSVVRDTGSSFVLDLTYEVPAYLGSASCYPYRSDWDFDPQLSLINGRVYIPLVGGRGDSTIGTFDRLSSTLVLDPTITAPPTALLTSTSMRWLDPFTSGDVQYDATLGNVLRSVNLRGYDLDFSNTDTGDIRAGKVLTFTTAGSIRPMHSGSRFTTSNDLSTGLTLPTDYNGILCRQASTSTYQSYLNNLLATQGSYGNDVPLCFINASSQAANSNTGKFRINQYTNNSTVYTYLYGLTGDPMGALTGYTSHSAREVLTFLWDNSVSRFQCTGKYRPWETVPVSVTGPTTIYGGLVNVNVTTGTTGTRDIRLPPVYNHDDEIIVKDVNGSAHLCPIRVNGQTGTIDGFSTATQFIINQPYGYLWVKYDSTAATWVIISERGTTRSTALAYPATGTANDVEGYGAVPVFGATLGAGGNPGIGWRRPERTIILAPRDVVRVGWSLDSADGCNYQTAVGDAGTLYIPVELDIGARLNAFYVYLQRMTGTGSAAATVATAMLQQRTLTVGNSAPGAWTNVAGFSSVNTTPANVVQELIVGATNYATGGYWTVLTGYDYRLVLTGETGTNAQTVKLLSMKAYVK